MGASRLTFGTDGVRGRAFEELDEAAVYALGRAANRALAGSTAESASADAAADSSSASGDGAAHRAERVSWVIGRDTRASGQALTDALVAGLRADGADVVDLGVVPTPVVAFAAERLAACGAVVSASHNPWPDNGVKLFAQGGTKLDDAAQSRVERCLDDLQQAQAGLQATQTIGGRRLASSDDDQPSGLAARLLQAYETSLREAIEGRRLDGLRLVVDGANGASAALAPDVLRRLGAQVSTVFCEPDGRNINDGCGSTHPGTLAETVTAQGADLGLAFDGDGDRLIAVDSDGRLIDGDRQMALFAVDLATRGLLAGDTLVVTVMSNLGLRRAMAAAGIDVVDTVVGDRAVLEALDAGGFSLGGEQSGHLIFRQEATTGDGLRNAVHLADLLVRRQLQAQARRPPSDRSSGASEVGSSGAAHCVPRSQARGTAQPQPRQTTGRHQALTSAQLAREAMQAAPQVLRNVPRVIRSGTESGSMPGTEPRTGWLARSLTDQTRRAVEDLAAQAGPDVRVLVRPSGTEPVIRVMVEARTERDAAIWADRLVEAVSSAAANSDASQTSDTAASAAARA